MCGRASDTPAVGRGELAAERRPLPSAAGANICSSARVRRCAVSGRRISPLERARRWAAGRASAVGCRCREHVPRLDRAPPAHIATGVAPPHSLEAEQSVLGGILLSDRAMYGLVIEEGLQARGLLPRAPSR